MSARDDTPPVAYKLTPQKERLLACYDAMNAFGADRLLAMAIELEKAFPAPKARLFTSRAVADGGGDV